MQLNSISECSLCQSSKGGPFRKRQSIFATTLGLGQENTHCTHLYLGEQSGVILCALLFLDVLINNGLSHKKVYIGKVLSQSIIVHNNCCALQGGPSLSTGLSTGESMRLASPDLSSSDSDMVSFQLLLPSRFFCHSPLQVYHLGCRNCSFLVDLVKLCVSCQVCVWILQILT